MSHDHLSRTEWCNGCSRLLAVPLFARTMRCAMCNSLTPLRPSAVSRPSPEYYDGSSTRLGKNWVKSFLLRLVNNIPGTNEYPASSSNGYNYGLPSAMPRPSTMGLVRGKKRALLIGISYKGKRYELKGTVNDVHCMKHFLLKNGFQEEYILVLTEDERRADRKPTKENIMWALNWLVKDCKDGDSLLFHFSGHGSQQVDTNGDEKDGWDETLCPMDYETSGMIVDDDLNDILVRPLRSGVKLHAIIDSCHSGTVLDLPHLCRMNGIGSYQWEDHSPPAGIYKGTSGGLAISISGCDDHQTSADTSALSGDVVTGAMTFCFIQAVEREHATTYGRLLLAMRSAIRKADTGIRLNGPLAALFKKVLPAGLTQEPQLCSSEKFDVFKKPFLL